jgi:iron complex outermembrane recepter protein
MLALMIRRSALIPIIASLLLISPSVMAGMDTPAKQHFDIPAGDLITSLELLAKASGIEILYDASLLKGESTQGVKGDLPPRAALAVLLESTGFTQIEGPNGLTRLERRPAGDTNVPAARLRADTADPPTASSKAPSELKELLVTGTHIAGEVPAGAALMVYSRDDIDQSGAATLDQFARQLPENFGGADAIGTLNNNANLGILPQGASSNVFGGAAFDLNGLGVGATLTLLNGHRLAPSGFDGSFVDVSQIPLSAVDHIEVLNDGASAIYGTDAIAGVVNIVTRRDYNGAETTLRYGTSSEGGDMEETASALVGRGWGSGNFMLDYEYDYAQGLDASGRRWIAMEPGPFSLIPENRRNSVFASVTQDLGPRSTLSMDVLAGERGNLINSPLSFGGDRNESPTLIGHAIQSATSLTIDHRFFDDWNANLTGNYAAIRQVSGTNGYPLANIVSSENVSNQYQTANSKILEADSHASGSVLTLPTGTVKISLGSSYRKEDFESSGQPGFIPISLSRKVASGYGELLLPLAGKDMSFPGVRRLELSVAYRYDKYQDFGPTSNPKVGLLWAPLADMSLRGTYDSSFQAPFLAQLGAPVNSNAVLIPDRSGTADILEVSGGNPNLQSERSKSLTLGVDATPGYLPGLTVSTTFFHVVIRNRIQTQNITSDALFSQPLLQPYLSLNPSLATVQSYFNSPGFYGDFAGLGPSHVAAIFDNRLANMYSTIQSGLHLTATYDWLTDLGAFKVSLLGTHILSYRLEPAALGPSFNVDNTIAEPTNWRLQGTVTWTRGPLSARLAINYVNRYSNTLFTPPETINSWTTADLFLVYKTGPAQPLWARNSEISFGVQNLADQRPPEVEIPANDLLPGRNGIPFDGANASPVGRYLFLKVAKTF